MQTTTERGLTAEDFASNQKLWSEYIDTDNSALFNSHSYNERVTLAQSVIDSNK